MPALPTLPSGRARARRAGWAALLLGVLLAHGLLLTGWPAGADGAAPAAARPLSVRQIVTPREPPPLVHSALPPPTRQAPRTALRPQPTVDTPALVQTAAVAAPEPAREAQAPAAEPQVASDAADGAPPPVYATRPPPPALLRYELRRGLLTGQGLLAWRPGPEGYEIEIEGTAFGLPLLAWASRGGFDSAGLAPQRFVDRRRGRELRAANFQRDKGVISWSSVTTEHPLLPGAQDRSSWIPQLAAIVAAEPDRFVPGQQVQMQVAGARGDADLWTFAVVGTEDVDVVGGRVEGTLALRREPRKPFDTQVHVWLDPARHHLPVRLRLSTAGGGDGVEFVLKP